jgi:hypothetical protein
VLCKHDSSYIGYESYNEDIEYHDDNQYYKRKYSYQTNSLQGKAHYNQDDTLIFDAGMEFSLITSESFRNCEANAYSVNTIEYMMEKVENGYKLMQVISWDENYRYTTSRDENGMFTTFNGPYVSGSCKRIDYFYIANN